MASYDPYENRVVTSKSASNVEVFIHLVKCSFGIGVLSLPFAINRSGYLVSTIIGIPLLLIIAYAMHVLIGTMVRVSALELQPYTSYKDCIEILVKSGPKNLQSSATCAKYTVETLLVAYPMGICAAYVIFMANSMTELYVLVHINYSTYLYQVMLVAPLFIINCIPNLHRMTAFSAVADILTLACFTAIFYYIFGEEPHINGNHEMVGANPLHLPLIIGPILFALEAVSVILSLEERMKTPRSFLGFFGIYNAAILLVILFYAAIGISAYIKYGDNVKPTITSNLPENWVSYSFKILFIVIIYLSYPIQCYPVIAILWEDKLSLKVTSKTKNILYEYLFRFGVTVTTVLLAIAVPKFEVAITLIGAICISTLGLFLPGYIEFLLCWKLEEGKYNFTMVKDISMMILGFSILVVVVICSAIDEITLIVQTWDTKSGTPEKHKGFYGM